MTVSVYFRALVGMMMYNPETNEIAKPSELLNSVRAIITVLQSVENYSKFFSAHIVLFEWLILTNFTYYLSFITYNSSTHFVFTYFTFDG